LPCPTTIFTIGVLCFLATPHPRYVLLTPILWSVVGTQAAFLFGVHQDLARISHQGARWSRRDLDSQEIIRGSGIPAVFPTEKNFLWIQRSSEGSLSWWEMRASTGSGWNSRRAVDVSDE
jgi:hypothetical protein